jgi:hypothetical protein
MTATLSVFEVFTSGLICFLLVFIISGICIALCHPKPRIKYAVSCGFYVYIPLTIAWYAVDILQFVGNDIKDENGVGLAPI